MVTQVTIERDQRISCSNCSTECPKVFEHSPDDGLSQIVAKYRVTPEALGTGEIPPSQRNSTPPAPGPGIPPLPEKPEGAIGGRRRIRGRWCCYASLSIIIGAIAVILIVWLLFLSP